MKTCFLLLGFLFSFYLTSVAQYEMVVDDPSNSWDPNSKEKHAIRIDSLSKLPAIIQLNIKDHFSFMLGNLYSYTTFQQGRIYDLEGLFRDEPDIYKRYSVVPKYELNFIITDTSIGIKRYNLYLKLDQYGQILQVNWPRWGYNDKKEFKPGTEIQNYALEQAKSKGYFSPDSVDSIFHNYSYHIDFKFDHIENRLVWVFRFEDEAKREGCWIYWNILEIDWRWMIITDEYSDRFTPCY